MCHGAFSNSTLLHSPPTVLGPDARPAHGTCHHHRHPRVSAIQATRHPLSPTQALSLLQPCTVVTWCCPPRVLHPCPPPPPPTHTPYTRALPCSALREHLCESLRPHPPHPPTTHPKQAAIFNFASWVSVFLLFVCACTYLHTKLDSDCSLMGRPSKFAKTWQHGIGGLWWKAARIGERCSPYVSVACVLMAIHTLFF